MMSLIDPHGRLIVATNLGDAKRKQYARKGTAKSQAAAVQAPGCAEETV